MNYFPLDMASAATALATVIALSALFVTILLIFWPRPHASSIKLLGSLMVLTLAFASNNAGVYALAIFIVATLVTELDFLEKLAAIFWNREKYWEYKMKSASTSEVEAKHRKEITEKVAASTSLKVLPESSAEDHNKIRRSAEKESFNKAIAFERAVLDALRSGRGPFVPARVNSNVKIVSRYGKTIIYDAIVETPRVHYVIEVKHLVSDLDPIVYQLDGLISEYRNYLLERGISTNVVPVAVVPSDENTPSKFKDVLFLKFNMQSLEFTNMDIMNKYFT